MDVSKRVTKETEIVEGLIVTPLKRIFHPQGDIFHALKRSEGTFETFGEAYLRLLIMVKPRDGKSIQK